MCPRGGCHGGGDALTSQGRHEIVRIAARGDGVTAEGRHVAGSAPGDWLTDDGTLIAGPHRAIPPCPHFGRCGGCQLQHIDDESYAQFIVDRINGALAEHGLSPPAMAPVHLSPPAKRRRATLRAERRGRGVTLGFNEEVSHRIVDLRTCDVMLPALVAMIAPLRRLLGLVMPDRARATITMTRVDQGVDLALAGFEVSALPALEALNDFAGSHKLARLSLDEGYGPTARWMPSPPTVTLSGTPVALPTGAFLQATADGEAALVAAVRRATAGALHVADLFAGLGTFALALGKHVTAIEGSRDLTLALKSAGGVTIEHRDLFRRPVAASELAALDAVVLDPPRAGAKEQVAQLALSQVPRIAYVSCNPATFARDARTLIDGGYRLVDVAPVGQFRWSTHVELVASFTRNS